MNLELSEAEAEALIKLLKDTIEGSHYPLSPRIRTLRGIRDRLRPEPAPQRYEPPPKSRYRRRG